MKKSRFTAEQIVAILNEAAAKETKLAEICRRHGVDEIGYLPVSRTGAMLFFQLMARRYEHASTVLTSNKSFTEWGDVFGDDVMAAALIDRLVHHCHIVNIRGNSYRMRHHTELTRALGATRHPPARGPQRGSTPTHPKAENLSA